ncbi:MAG: hypothetical protein ACFBSC_11410 [Microcoleaceae cyanobacterium]
MESQTQIPIKIPIIDDQLFMNLEFLQPLNLELLRIAEEMIYLGQDKIPAGLVLCDRLGTPNLQVWMNAPTQKLFNTHGKELTRRDMSKYWLTADKERFYSEVKGVSHNGSFIFKYRARKAKAAISNFNPWLELTAEMKIFELFGHRYRLSVTKESREISCPFGD